MILKSEKVEKILGFCGAMLSSSKSGYVDKHLTNLVSFNANLVTADGKKIWYGDLDVTKCEDKLIECAKALDTTIFVLSEMDARFQNEDDPKIERALYIADKRGGVVGPRYARYFKRSETGIGRIKL